MNGVIVYEFYTGNDINNYITRSIAIRGNVWNALEG